ncbi:DJ-1/PfpI family protein [Brevibacillus migulae]|uniref:DJ-1/PfpI family protein n=1 Tax=Brevibacillus migulae TaxID=1644114 RepID=UPI00106DDF35|nr:DJ-1/PfpI family protein [Brevibacillus migulae]
MKIALIAFDQFTDLDLFLPWDLLNRVRIECGVADWEVSILGTAASHVSMSGLRIPVTGNIEEAADADAVVFGSGKGVIPLLADRDYLARYSLSPDRQLITAMCSGSLLLAALGLLQGKKATTYPTRRTALAGYGVEVVDKDFVTDGRIATAAGCLAAVALSRWLIAALHSEELASRVLQTVQPVGQV